MENEEQKIEENKELEGLQNAKLKLIAEIAELRGEKRVLKEIPSSKEEESSQPEQKTVESAEDGLDTAEGWKNLIDKKNEEKMKPVLSDIEKLKEKQFQKAVTKIVASHPEYADEAQKKVLLDTYNRIKSRGDLDSDDILEDLYDAYAVENRKAIIEKEQRAQRYYAESAVADIATTGAGTSEKSIPANVDAEPSDYRVAKSIGMPIEKYMKLKKEAETMETNFGY